MKITPRDYQQEEIDRGIEFFNSKGKKKPSLIVSPVASGKSIIIGGIAKGTLDPTLILQPSKELLEQNYNKLISFGGEASLFSASVGSKELGFNTYGTLGSIKKLGKEFKEYGIKNVIIDEAHMSFSPDPNSMFRKFMKDLNPRATLGFTATPIRLKNYGNFDESWSQLNFITRGIPRFFNTILSVVPIQMMVERGYWAKLKYEQYNFDEGKLMLNSTGAEYTEISIKEAIAEQGINNNIYLRLKGLLKEGRKNILVFCDSLETAIKMASLFPDIAECVHGKTPKKERSSIIERFVKGDLRIVTNFGTLTTGFDHPELDTVIMGRPTQSLALYYQIAGRGTRIHPDKKDCLLIDFCNNVKRFGKLEDFRFEYIEGFGWALFSNEILLSNTRMDGEPTTKEDLLKSISNKKEDDIDMKLTFGKYSGKRVSELPINYVEWAIKNWDFSSPNMKILEGQMAKRLV